MFSYMVKVANLGMPVAPGTGAMPGTTPSESTQAASGIAPPMPANPPMPKTAKLRSGAGKRIATDALGSALLSGGLSAGLTAAGGGPAGEAGLIGGGAGLLLGGVGGYMDELQMAKMMQDPKTRALITHLERKQKTAGVRELLTKMLVGSTVGAGASAVKGKPDGKHVEPKRMAAMAGVGAGLAGVGHQIQEGAKASRVAKLLARARP